MQLVRSPSEPAEENANQIWRAIRKEVQTVLVSEPLLTEFMRPIVLRHENIGQALAALLAQKMSCPTLSEGTLEDLILEALDSDPYITHAASRDLEAFFERDPACDRYSVPFLYHKGFQGLQMHRVGHWLWHQGRQELAHYIQSRISETFALDIHPAAKIGHGILIDHATSLVIGETAVVGNNVSMLHEVTLGGTGKQSGDRHPKIGTGVLIGAGAKILGNVAVGDGAKIGAGSVVLDNVASGSTVAGVPAKPVGQTGLIAPALEMDHSIK
ncbi:MAG: serine O-acetyltransferase [Pseudomonadota bacterium]